MLPTLAILNQVNRARVDSGNDCQRVCGNAKTQRFANMNNLLLRQFVSRVFFTAQVNKTCFPSVFRVVSNSQPFKILRAVVKFVAINVIDRQMRLISGNKSSSNQPVNKNFYSFAVSHAGYVQVAAMVKPRGKFFRWDFPNKCLRLAQSRSGSSASISRTPDRTVWINKPHNAFVFDGYWIHSVNIVAGH